ncbi:MAG: hypothetical protein AB1427_16725 [Thermodesulfobacteriota bacterium]
MWIYDFDGVLLNSLDEVAVSAFNAVTGKMVKTIEELPDGLVRLFKRNRFHFQPAGDVLPLMQWSLDTYLDQPGKLLTRDEFSIIIDNTIEPLINRTKRFYAARNRFAEQDSRRWLSLNRPFQPIWDALIARGGEHVILLTNKNRRAVFTQCRHFGLDVSEKNIYAGDDGATKTSNLDAIFRRFDARPICFIDDSLRNLQDLNAHFNRPLQRLSLFLAVWGFIGPDDIETARAAGIPVLSQKDLLARLGAEAV